MADALTARITELLTPSIESLGYEVVRIRLTGSGTQTLQVMADRSDDIDINVEDCATISRNISAILDVEDPISGEYNLEVSSPGIDRPLTRTKDFSRWAGFDMKFELRMMVDGQKRYRGKLLGISDSDEIAVRLDSGEDMSVAFGDITSAKLLLTDELLEAVEAQRAEQQQA